MWGDRFIDGSVTGLGKWEAAINDTAPALGMVPRDIVICDWHYDSAPPTASRFAIEGFQVVSSAWRRPRVALGQLELMRQARTASTPEIASRSLGVLQTTWVDTGGFIKAYFGDKTAAPGTIEAVLSFKELFREIRAAGFR